VLEKQVPESAAVLNLVAARHMVAGRPTQARAAWTRVVTSLPDNLEALEGLVSLAVQQKRPADAVARVEAVLKRFPASGELLTLAAAANTAAGNTQRAEALLRQAIDVEPHRMVPYEQLGRLYAGQRRLDDARDQFAELVRRNPRSVSAHTMLAMIQEVLRDTAAAEARYQQALAVDPEAAVAANNLAWIYVASDRHLDQALQLAQTAFKHLPDNPQVNDTLGWAYYKKQDYAAAVRHLEAAVGRQADDPTMRYRLGLAYVKAGDPAKAKQNLERALAISANFDGAADARLVLGTLK
jgi:tetratricopeptide (TPR) repeat protein